MGSLSPSSSFASHPPGFSQAAAAAVSGTLPLSLEDGELAPHAELSSNAGVVPEFKPGSDRAKEPVVSVFIGNLPPQANKRWIFNYFKSYGIVADYHIPDGVSKATKKPYGFVRFFSVDAANRAVAQSNGAWVDGFRLEVALARFPKRTAMAILPDRSRAISKMGAGEFKTPFQGFGSTAYPAKSFAQALLGRNDVPVSGLGKPVSSSLMVHSVACDCSWATLSATANITWGANLEDVMEGLLKKTAGLSSIKRLGVRKIFLVFDSIASRTEALDKSDWMGLVEDATVWNGELVCGKKLWRLSCIGIPISAWCHGTFVSIASVWGSLVALEAATSNGTNFSAANFVIESDAEVISSKLDLEVDGQIFPVRVSGVMVEEASGKPMVVYRKTLIGEDVPVGVDVPVVEVDHRVGILKPGVSLHEKGMVQVALSTNEEKFSNVAAGLPELVPSPIGAVETFESNLDHVVECSLVQIPLDGDSSIANKDSPKKQRMTSVGNSGLQKKGSIRSGFLLGSSLGIDVGPNRAKFGPLSSIILKSNSSRKSNKISHGKQHSGNSKNNDSIANEISSTRKFGNIIGVCLDNVDDEYINATIRREKADSCQEG